MVRQACLPAGRLTMSGQIPLILSLSKDELVEGRALAN
jgi:hypothetical protein